MNFRKFTAKNEKKRIIGSFALLIYLVFFLNNAIKIVSPISLNQDYLELNPFSINSNSDFEIFFSGINDTNKGSGTANDPWIIESYNISSINKDFCISIANITDYFIIRNCFFTNSKEGYTGAIKILNSSNGVIENNVVENTNWGIFLNNSMNIELRTNRFLKTNGFALLVYNSEKFMIRSNIIAKTLYSGIRIVNSNQIIIEKNNIENSISLIELINSYNNNISTNFLSNGNFGIQLENSSYNAIYQNSIKNCYEGIVFLKSVKNQINSNIFSGNNKNYSWNPASLSKEQTIVSGNQYYNGFEIPFLIILCVGFILFIISYKKTQKKDKENELLNDFIKNSNKLDIQDMNKNKTVLSDILKNFKINFSILRNNLVQYIYTIIFAIIMNFLFRFLILIIIEILDLIVASKVSLWNLNFLNHSTSIFVFNLFVDTIIYQTFISTQYGLSFEIMTKGDVIIDFKSTFQHFKRNWFRYFALNIILGWTFFLITPTRIIIVGDNLLSIGYFLNYIFKPLLNLVLMIFLIESFPSVTLKQNLKESILDSLRILKKYPKKVLYTWILFFLFFYLPIILSIGFYFFFNKILFWIYIFQIFVLIYYFLGIPLMSLLATQIYNFYLFENLNQLRTQKMK